MNPLLASALPDDGTGYVFAGYIFFFLLLLIYLWILGAKYQRLNREVVRISEELESVAPPEATVEKPARQD